LANTYHAKLNNVDGNRHLVEPVNAAPAMLRDDRQQMGMMIRRNRLLKMPMLDWCREGNYLLQHILRQDGKKLP